MTVETENTRKKRSIGLTILLALLLLIISVVMYFGGLVIGIMATDSCSGSTNDFPLIIWLFGVTPILLLIATFIPLILFYQGRSPSTVVLSLLAPGVTLGICGLAYLAIVVSLCG